MKNILIFTNSFYPSFKSGGPVRSLSNLVSLLSELNNIDIVTKDRDLGDKKEFDNINVNSWNNKFHNANVFYLNSLFYFLKNIKVILNKEYDIIYLNSFFDFKFSIIFYLLSFFNIIKVKKVLLAPRGELTDGAMSLKATKKNIFIFVFNILNIKNKMKFHFTSIDEKNEAFKYIGECDYVLAPNMHEQYPLYLNKEKEKNELNMVFISRVSRKKRLDIALNALAADFLSDEQYKINFSIIGHIDDPLYYKECLSLIELLPSNIKVTFLGGKNRNEIFDYFNSNHLFILPTLNENYGHAIVEAMSHSCLVLLSNNTPWNDVANFGSYICENEKINDYSKVIESVLTMGQIEFNQRTLLTYDYCINNLDNNEKKAISIFGE